MTDHQLYCNVTDCEDPENPGFARPAFRSGKCSSHMKQLQRTGRTTTIAPKVSLEDRLFTEATRMVDVDTSINADREEAEARRNVLTIAKQLGRKEVAETIKRALATVRAQGVRLGRPPKKTAEEVRHVFEVIGTVSKTALALRLSRITVRRYLRMTDKKTRISDQRRPRSERPRAGRGS